MIAAEAFHQKTATGIFGAWAVGPRGAEAVEVELPPYPLKIPNLKP